MISYERRSRNTGTSASSVTGEDFNINPTKDKESTINPNSNEDNDVSSIT